MASSTNKYLDDAARREAAGDEESRAGRAEETSDAQAAEIARAAADLDRLARERDEYRDLLLRKSAEFDNYRKRVERERGELAEFAAADLVTQLLPVVDNLERALSAADDTASIDAYRQGVALIRQQLLDVLQKRGVTPIEAVGADFDPHLHHAVSQEPSEAHRDGEVIEELRRGYKIGERLLRPALVKVATRE